MIGFFLTGLFLLVSIFVLTLLFADELVKVFGPKAHYTHPSLPQGCTFVVWQRFCDIVGKPIGGAGAVTVGKTVVVSRATFGNVLDFQKKMLHESEHCRQRLKLGRKYLLVYVLKSLRGYMKNPMEIAAMKAAGEIA